MAPPTLAQQLNDHLAAHLPSDPLREIWERASTLARFRLLAEGTLAPTHVFSDGASLLQLCIQTNDAVPSASDTLPLTDPSAAWPEPPLSSGFLISLLIAHRAQPFWNHAPGNPRERYVPTDALDYFLSHQRHEVIEGLLQRSDRPDTENLNQRIDPTHNQPWAHVFALTNNQKMLTLWVEQGIAVNALNDACKTPLFFADTLETLNFLLAQGNDPNAKDVRGNTVLFTQKKLHLADRLVEAGIDLESVNRKGDNVFNEWTRDLGNSAQIDWLITQRPAFQNQHALEKMTEFDFSDVETFLDTVRHTGRMMGSTPLVYSTPGFLAARIIVNPRHHTSEHQHEKFQAWIKNLRPNELLHESLEGIPDGVLLLESLALCSNYHPTHGKSLRIQTQALKDVILMAERQQGAFLSCLDPGARLITTARLLARTDLGIGISQDQHQYLLKKLWAERLQKIGHNNTKGDQTPTHDVNPFEGADRASILKASKLLLKAKRPHLIFAHLGHALAAPFLATSSPPPGKNDFHQVLSLAFSATKELSRLYSSGLKTRNAWAGVLEHWATQGWFPPETPDVKRVLHALDKTEPGFSQTLAHQRLLASVPLADDTVARKPRF